ncbi:phosphoribosylamine--glycine ligase [Chitinophagaceae bacterium LB-8]|uniref:Phosphoribosylamine--glycine ligase n=1 Tax=Paraflavisolibacter caeni TaxID=2982496 RepID=A0A9X2XPH7_9BACT|nr:phosphoribosylamine--glycine ligase [Paraflavisolibacter caeni]MCU7550919.1 phosphoribosylamine--glycine ligase [Paraflavisolibacter caeni]
MNILLLGSGGREHALAWKMAQSEHCENLLIAPGNPGTAELGTNLPFSVTDFEAIKNCCLDKNIGLLVVGPEEPLVKGLVDFLKKEASLSHLLIIGPSQEAAQLEGSKAYAKAFMQRHGIPTAAYQEFTADNFELGKQYIQQHSLPIVLKADGLAAGKGVIIAQTHQEALREFEQMIQQSKFGEASKKVVIEQFLDGIELSVFALTDGKNYVLLPEAKDYKRIGEGDTGLNTGGMGAISPVPFADDAFMQKVIQKVVEPTIAGLAKDNLDYKGFVFFGLIKVAGEPYVIEYNCRMGDPETEVVMPRLKSDLVPLLIAAAQQKLEGATVETDERFAATIVAVSGGYPNDYLTGFEICGLEEEVEDTIIFHAGTKAEGDNIVTKGGRVICATGLGDTLKEAIKKSKQGMRQIQFSGMYYRRDIGYEFK